MGRDLGAIDGEPRIRAVRELIGTPDASAAALPQALRRETQHHFRRHVEPLIDRCWPELRATRFYDKLQIGAQTVYGPAPYTVMVVSRRRPLPVRVLSACCRALRLDVGGLTFGLRWLLPLYSRWLMPSQSRRIALMAAFIAVVDEAFDHHLGDVPLDERASCLRALLAGTGAPTHPAFALVRALQEALIEDASAEELPQLQAAFDGCVRWGEAEVRRARCEPDPEHLSHRGVGIATGIDGLAFTVRQHIGPAEHQWMYAVSHFIQMLDDWVDLEADLAEGVRTPVAEGHWTIATLRESFAQTTADIGRIVVDNGEHNPAVAELARRSYVWQVQDLLQSMLSGRAN